jgi:hypothetical protein
LVEAMDLVDDDGTISQYRQQAQTRVTVFHETQKLVHCCTEIAA